MVLFDKNGNPKLYDSSDLIKITRLISDIRYANGFIEAVSWEYNPSVSNSTLSKEQAIIAMKLIKKYEKIAPEEIKKQFDFNGLEKTCKEILKK